jgi:hypothetical protein
VTPDSVKEIHAACKLRCLKTLSEYGVTREMLEVRHLEKLDCVLDAETNDDAYRLAKRAEDSILLFCLNLTRLGKVTGPQKPERYEARAQDADEKAAELEGENKAEEAAAYRQKAADLRAYADVIRNTAPGEAIPPPPEHLRTTPRAKRAKREAHTISNHKPALRRRKPTV